MILTTQYRLFLCPKSANKKQIGDDPIISVVDIIVVVGVAIVVDIARVITIVIVRRTQPPPADRRQAQRQFLSSSAYIVRAVAH